MQQNLLELLDDLKSDYEHGKKAGKDPRYLEEVRTTALITLKEFISLELNWLFDKTRHSESGNALNSARDQVAHAVRFGSIVPYHLCEIIADSLLALNSGETSEFFEPSSGFQRKSAKTKNDLKLQLLMHVHFLYGAESTDAPTLEKGREFVGDLVGASGATIRSWEQRDLPNALDMDIKSFLKRAERAGQLEGVQSRDNKIDRDDVLANGLRKLLVSNRSLEVVAEEYKAAQRQ